MEASAPQPGGTGEPSDRDPQAEAIAQLHARFARTIHEHVLQSLAISLMQVELSKRLCESGQQAEAIAELDTAVTQLQAAADVLHQLMRDLSTTDPIELKAS